MNTNGVIQPAAASMDLESGIYWHNPPLTTEDRLARIRVLGERIAAHVRFIDGVGDLKGTSAEAKQRAVAGFCECLTSLERALNRIGDDLRLG